MNQNRGFVNINSFGDIYLPLHIVSILQSFRHRMYAAEKVGEKTRWIPRDRWRESISSSALKLGFSYGKKEERTDSLKQRKPLSVEK